MNWVRKRKGVQGCGVEWVGEREDRGGQGHSRKAWQAYQDKDNGFDPKYAGVPPQDFERENRKQTARGKGEAVTW